MDRAYGLMQESPDSALAILRNIQPGELHFNSQKARYSLLLSMALDKNYIDVKSDSIIKKAVKWYGHSLDRHSRMLALYYAARVEYNAENHPKAALYTHQALDLSQADPYYEGLSAWLLADIYYDNHNYVRARDCYSRADDAFLRAGKAEHCSYSKCEAAKTLISTGEFESCDSLLLQVDTLGADKGLLSTYYSLKSRLLSLQGKDSEAIEAFCEWETLPYRINAMLVYGEIANSFSRSGNHAMAAECMEKAYSLATEQTRPIVSSFNARILYNDGHYKEAIDSLSSGFEYQNRIAIKQFSNSIEAAYAELYSAESARRISEMRAKTHLLALLLVVLVLAGGVVFAVKRRQYNERLSAARAEIELVTQENRDKLKELNKFIQSRQKFLGEVVTGRSFLIDEVIMDFRDGGDCLKQLVKDMNACFDGIVKKLSETYPDMSKIEYRILVYYFAGFSHETISFLSGFSVSTLYNLKRRWVVSFDSLPSPERELFLSRMNTSRGRS